ncbi:MAG: hypothetical protein ACI4JS_03435 [Oscillospiraceae bacterium]
MFELFETLAPENEERLSDKRVDKIKASVLSRIEEDKPMKKHFTIKPLLIAAAITATGTISALSAGAVTTPAISDEKLPAATVAVQPEAPAIPAAPENDTKPDTTPEPAVSADGTYFEYEGRNIKIIEEKASDMELIGMDDDGTRHYKSRYGGTTSHWCNDGDDCDNSDWGTCLFVYVD